MKRKWAPRQYLICWGPPLTWMALIFTLSSQSKLPTPPQPLVAQLLQVGGHMIAFGVLLLLLLRSMKSTWPGQKVASWALLVTLLYALADEYHQSFVPGRNATLLDVAVDVAGMLLSLGILTWWQTR
ncbi:MAG TPA: VanZ family protein [Anaerolineae bacterium]|nr:VanZ family protein [Anaerolineae bacterium]